MTSGLDVARTNIVTIEPDDILPDVFDRIRAAGQTPVELTIPSESPLFLTAAEFRTLRDVMDHGRHAVVIKTRDPLRLQLARLFGLDTVIPENTPVPAPAVGSKVKSRQVTATKAGKAAPPESNTNVEGTPASEALPSKRPFTADETHAPIAEAQPEVSAADADARWPEPPELRPVPPVHQRLLDRASAAIARHRADRAPMSEPAARPEPALIGPPVPLENGQTDGDANAAADPERIQWIDARRRASPLVIAGAALLAVLVVIIGVNFLLAGVRVNLVLASLPVSEELFFDVTRDGQALDPQAAFALSGEPATVTVAFEASIPTTGTVAIPDGSATGVVRLANPTAEELTVDAGTVVSTESGAEFVFADSVVVPAADAATQAPGQAEGEIRAVNPGTGGNVDTGEVGGRLPNGVYYSNREGPTSGGTDREVRVVAEADIATLMETADAGVLDLVEAEIRANPSDYGTSRMIVTPTLSVLERDDRFSAVVGEKAETVGLRTEQTVSILTYREDAATERIMAELEERLGSSLPAGYRLAEIHIGAGDVSPVSGSEEGGTLRVTAEGETRLALEDDKREELAGRLAGKDDNEVDSILRSMPEVEQFSVDYGPRLFSQGMPVNAGRIEIDDGS